jgi:dihydropyrimidinase
MGYKKRGMMVSTAFMLQAFEAIRSCGGMAMVHAENGPLIDYLQEKFISEGLTDPRRYPETCPHTAEVLAIMEATELAHISRCPLYIVHLSTAEGLRYIRAAREDGKDVSTETCPQYLLLTENDMERYGPYAKVGPPLRTHDDTEALWRGLSNRSISLLSSDHAAHSRESKEPGWKDIFEAPVGMIGVETLAPLMFSEGVMKRHLPLTWFSCVMSEAPAKVFGLYPQKGVISVGADADLTIIDPEKEVTIRAEDLHSMAGYSLYDGWKVKGYPVMTLLRGKVLLNEGQLEQGPGYGKYLARPVPRI